MQYSTDSFLSAHAVQHRQSLERACDRYEFVACAAALVLEK